MMSTTRRPRARAPLETRFYTRVDRSGGPDACWPHSWPHSRVSVEGHVEGRTALEPRRVAWFLKHGTVPPQTTHIEVACGEPLCVNPKHLICPTPEERAWSFVKKGAPDECWEWTSHRTKRNYGQFKRFGRHGVAVFAHRFIYETVHGPIGSKDLVVCHHCDNPPCCNPAHLFLGTHADNIHDCIAKGRNSRGAAHAEKMRLAREARANMKRLAALRALLQHGTGEGG